MMKKDDFPEGINFINKDGRRIISAEHNKYLEGVFLATQLNCNGFYLKADSFSQTQQVNIDFSLLDRVRSIDELAIGPNIKFSPDQDFSPLYALSKLTSLTIHVKGISIDFNRFSKLTNLTATYSKKFSNFSALTNLRNLWLWHLNTNDFGFFGDFPNLRELKITQSQIRSLDGLSGCENLEKLHLIRCTKLLNLSGIDALKKLNGVFIINSKQMVNFSCLKGNCSIEQLGLNRVDSLDFIRYMPNLKTVGFDELIDGNIALALEIPHIERITFYPNKKHYTHTQQEVNEIIARRRLSA
ncbi:hypothetical protein ACFSFZ_01925 [Mixta tenebrionis]|uniref:Leucine-rich repeat domain-containing protein n=1 Tax=Mixta tenebrionis TaxID=2562439 RepID=A0A506V8T0_9GAMM|nr:leucine-rich repeat domain-containing protein [Mixta tenebrionis]TPW41936.1 leucine-rich repeat domain-containing protein [Mixta tenebrionis]